MKALEPYKDLAYLGDGAYVAHQGFQLWIAANRDGMTHMIALDDEALRQLIAYARRIGLLAKEKTT